VADGYAERRSALELLDEHLPGETVGNFRKTPTAASLRISSQRTCWASHTTSCESPS
jgi:hypothetical protein